MIAAENKWWYTASAMNATPAPDLQLFREVFDASPIGIAVENLDGQPIFVNPAFCAMLGFSEEELCRKHCVQFSPPEDAQKDWHFFEQLRAGLIDHYQLEKRYFRRDGSLVWGRLTISLLNRHPLPLVVAMVEDITEEKAAAEKQGTALQAREELLKIFVKNVPAGVAMLDREMRYLQVSDRFCTDYSLDSSEVIGRSHYEVFPDIPERWKELHRRALAGETLRADEDRWEREGGPIWLRWAIRPWWNSDGSQGGILIFAEEITRLKETEEALSKVNQKLIHAHEEERARIARELHDDISQRIALLAVSLYELQDDPGSSPAQLKHELINVSQEVQGLALDVQALSHYLHSSKLKEFGLEFAAAGFCKEFSEQKGVRIDFASEHVPKDLPEDISICLFRVLQEAVQNADKHSGSTHFEVSIRNRSDEIELTVQDSGIGFEPELGFHKGGLGLASMRERLKLVNGELSIASALQGGTTVRALVAHKLK